MDVDVDVDADFEVGADRPPEPAPAPPPAPPCVRFVGFFGDAVPGPRSVSSESLSEETAPPPILLAMAVTWSGWFCAHVVCFVKYAHEPY